MKTYASAGAFRRALEDRLRDRSPTRKVCASQPIAQKSAVGPRQRDKGCSCWTALA